MVGGETLLVTFTLTRPSNDPEPSQGFALEHYLGIDKFYHRDLLSTE